MAVRGYPNLQIELDASVGGALVDISRYVTSISGWSDDRMTEETTGAGESTDRYADVGFTRKESITLGGPYDDVANGLVAITQGARGEVRTLRLNAAGLQNPPVNTARESCECIIKTTTRNPSRDALTAYEVVLQRTGDITIG